MVSFRRPFDGRSMSFSKRIEKEPFVPKGSPPVFLTHPDEINLKLRIGETSKSWVFRFRKRRKVIGHYPEMSVTAAKEEVQRLKGGYASNLGADIEKRFRLDKASTLTFEQLAIKINETYPSPTLKTRFKHSRSALRTSWQMPISKISKSIVMKWMTTYGQDRKAATVKMHFDYLSGCLNKAVEMELLETNPLQGMKKPKVINQRTRHLGESCNREYQRFIDAIDAREDHMRPFCYLALYTGMRKGEILGLQWSFINWKDNYITLPKHKTSKYIGSKIIDMHPKVIDELKQWKTVCSSETYVFPHNSGFPIKDIKKAWATVLKHAGISDFKIHDLRHTFASQMLMAGASLSDIASIVGHTDPRMTSRYAHLSREHLKSALNRLK